MTSIKKHRIAMLAAASSIHTIRWANGLASLGHDLHLISQHSPKEPLSSRVTFHKIPYRGALGYFSMVPAVRKFLKNLKPDLLHAHYASGYGTTARLVKYRPYILSLWGSDIYEFPKKSPLHKWLVKKNLESADLVLSTSYCMSKVANTISENIKIPVTPFGVDLDNYKKIPPKNKDSDPFILGTIKTMDYKYGIDTLIEAFSIVTKRNSRKNIKLRLVGGGPLTQDYKRLAEKLNVQHLVEFIGHVPHARVSKELENIDLFVALSRQESFGVAAIEASAAGCPVVASDAEGLSEVIIHNKTGLIVPKENPELAALAIEKLLKNPQIRIDLGKQGKEYVFNTYSWSQSLETMVESYNKLLSTN